MHICLSKYNLMQPANSGGHTPTLLSETHIYTPFLETQPNT